VNGSCVTVRCSSQRFQAGSSIIQNLIEALKGGKSIGYFLRESLISVDEYESAVQLLSTQPLMAPVVRPSRPVQWWCSAVLY